MKLQYLGPGANRASAAPLRTGWVGLTALLFGSILAGLLLVFGGIYAAALLVTLMLFGAGLAISLRALFLLIVLLVFVVVGQIQYFGRVDKAFWIPYLLGLFLYVRLLGVAAGSQARSPLPHRAFGRSVVVLVVLFCITAMVASLFQRVPPIQWFVFGKEYFFLWGVLLLFLVQQVQPLEVERLFRLVPWFLLLQIPAVLYQRFYVATHRFGDSAFDAVVGLFGGDPTGGGASGAMAIFSVAMVGFALEGWRAHALGTGRMLVVLTLAIVPILLAEVKFAVILLPLVGVLVYGREFLRRPARAVAALTVGLLFAWGLLSVYFMQFTDSRTKEGRSLGDYVETVIERNTNSQSFNFRTGEIGRVAAFQFWWAQHGAADAVTTLVGHGVGATRFGALATGDVARRYHVRVGRSSLVMLLWETGLIGTGFLVTALLAAVVAALRLVRLQPNSPRSWFLRGSAIALGLVLLGLPYNTDFIEVAPIQVLTFMLIGYVIMLGRTLAPNSVSRTHRT